MGLTSLCVRYPMPRWKMQLRVGQGALLAKLDIKAAYRNIPVHPGDRHLLGMC